MPPALSLLDRLVIQADHLLRTLSLPAEAARARPDAQTHEATLSDAERELAGRLMRVNHSGEIAAQALYHGQALVARASAVRDSLETAAREENDHLAWTAARAHELGTHTSYLAPAWYAGSFLIGATAAVIGDRTSLGFVAETERQVVEHLDGHLARLPAADAKSRAILEQMREDEAAHATRAIEHGAVTLPWPVRAWMRLASRVMTETAYWV